MKVTKDGISSKNFNVEGKLRIKAWKGKFQAKTSTLNEGHSGISRQIFQHRMDTT